VTKAIGLDKDLGSIEVGKLADLVILRAVPLENLRNTHTMDLVMKNGRLYDGDNLTAGQSRAFLRGKIEILFSCANRNP